MPALAELQRSFAAALFGGDPAIAAAIVDDGIAAEDRLRIYGNTARVALTAALRLSYPCTDRLVGRDFFDMAAARFIRAAPPRGGCLADYGGGFADFLAALLEAAGVPYLADVARFEWALARAAAAEDAPVLDVRAVADVDARDHDRLRFVAHPSVALLRLRYPADAIADAVAADDDAAMGAIELDAGPVAIVVHRGGAGVQAERISDAAFAFLQRLFAGEPLGAVLANTDAEAALLAEQFAKGRLSALQIGTSGDRDASR